MSFVSISSLWTNQHLDLALKPFAQAILLVFQVKAHLQIKPEALGSPEVSRQPKGRVRADRPCSVNDFIDSPRGHADILGKPVLAYTQGLQKLVQKHLARMNGFEFSFVHGHRLMVVGDLDIVGPVLNDGGKVALVGEREVET